MTATVIVFFVTVIPYEMKPYFPRQRNTHLQYIYQSYQSTFIHLTLVYHKEGKDHEQKTGTADLSATASRGQSAQSRGNRQGKILEIK